MNPLSFQSAFCIIHALSLVFSCPGGYNHHRGADTELHICTQKGCTMNNTLLATSQRMIELRDILKKVFRFENSYIYPVCAAALLQSEEPLSEDELTRARDLVRQSTGIFSNFRSMMLMPTACYLAAHGNDTAYLHEALDLYERLKKTFRGSEYTALLSLVLPVSSPDPVTGWVSAHFGHVRAALSGAFTAGFLSGNLPLVFVSAVPALLLSAFCFCAPVMLVLILVEVVVKMHESSARGAAHVVCAISRLTM